MKPKPHAGYNAPFTEKSPEEYRSQAVSIRIKRGLQPADFIAMDDDELDIFCKRFAALVEALQAVEAAYYPNAKNHPDCELIPAVRLARAALAAAKGGATP